MRLLKLYRFPITIFLLAFLLTLIVINDILASSTIKLSNRQVSYTTSAGGRWGAFSHDQEIRDGSAGKMYIKTYRTFCISNLFVSPQKAMKADITYLVVPASQMNKSSDITYYTLTAKPLSAFALFFHILAYFISNHLYLTIPIALLFAVFRKELDADYQYANRVHKSMILTACYATIILIVLFAIY